MYNRNLNTYQQNQIKTASPEQILLMLYDGAIRFTRQAITGIENNDAQARRYGISKAMAIVVEFSNSLDREIGGKIAEDLDALYDYMVRQMTEANLKNDAEKLQVVLTLLTDLRQTWSEAVEINRKEMSGTTQISEIPPSNQQNYSSFSISR
jgi:flagellar secretion chaperone FliS